MIFVGVQSTPESDFDNGNINLLVCGNIGRP